MDGKLIVILGGGESGVGSAILAQKKGFRVHPIPGSVWGIPVGRYGRHGPQSVAGKYPGVGPGLFR